DARLAGLLVDEAALRNNGNLLPADGDRFGDVVRVRPCIRDVLGIERRARAGDDDDEEDGEEAEGDVVPAEAAPREIPGASALDRTAVMLFAGKLSRRVERELRLGCPLRHSSLL